MRTLITSAISFNGSPIRMRSAKPQFPAVVTRVLIGEIGVMNALDAARATIIANG